MEVQNVAVDTAAGHQNTVSFWMKWDGTYMKMPFGWNVPYDLLCPSGKRAKGIFPATGGVTGEARRVLATG
jgi:hypothetical protein